MEQAYSFPVKARHQGWLWALLLGLAGLAVYCTFHRSLSGEDEAWIGETAYWLRQDGVVRSQLWKGYYLHDRQIIVYHQLFTKLTAALLYVLPWHISTIRLISLFSGLVLLAQLMCYVRLQQRYPWHLVALTGVLFLLVPFDFEFLSFYRPEMLVACFGFGSYWALRQGLERHGAWVLLSGALAGLAMYSHLNGLIYIGASGLLLALERRFGLMLLFGLLALLAFSPYLLEVLPQADLWWYQFNATANSSAKGLGWLSPVVNLLNEHKRLFRGPHTIVTSALFLVSLWLLWRKAARPDRLLMRYTLLLLLVLAVAATSKTSHYSVLFYPFVVLLIVQALVQYPQLKQRLNKVWQGMYLTCWAAFLGFSVFFISTHTFEAQQDKVAIHAQLARQMQPGAVVLAPMSFIFDQIARFDIRGISVLAETTNKNIRVQDVLAFAQAHRVQYIVLNAEWLKNIKDLRQNRPELERQFRQVAAVEDYVLLQKQ